MEVLLLRIKTYWCKIYGLYLRADRKYQTKIVIPLMLLRVETYIWLSRKALDAGLVKYKAAEIQDDIYQVERCVAKLKSIRNEKQEAGHGQGDH